VQATLPPSPSGIRKLPSGRARLAIGVLLSLFLVDLGRDVYLQILRQSELRQQGRLRYLRQIVEHAPRGEILAANGYPLAINTAAITIWADPRIVGRHRSLWPELAHALHISLKTLEARLQDGGKAFAYVLRQAPPAIGAIVRRLHIPGVHLAHSSHTYYPLGAITAPFLGLVDEAHRGATGLEFAYNRWLASHPAQNLALVDGRGQILNILGKQHVPSPGHSIRLSIRPKLQYWTYVALDDSLKRFHATDGSAVIMNVHSGHILAMASVPSCNPNRLSACSNPSDLANNAVHQAFEPGSVMKPFVVAAALASHSVAPTARFHVFHPLVVDGYRITDDVPHHVLSIEKILKYSSCIGASKIALLTPRRTIYDLYHAVGFGRRPDLGLPDETGGVLPNWRGWSQARHATIALGYGVSVTTMQLADAYAAIANGGYHVRPELFQNEQPERRRVMPQWVADTLRRWLQSVTRPNGTGILAAIPGYQVAGKTGTANMANGHGGFFHHRTNATFVGFAPGNHPLLVMAVSLRGSHIQWNFGGIEAAPVFRVAMSHALRALDIPPRCKEGGNMYIRVSEGATWTSLATRYHLSTAALLRLNRLPATEKLEAGTYLKVPVPRSQRDICRVQAPLVTRAQAEIWSEGGGS